MTGTADPADQPFDAGLQPERTALAWRRTSLSITVGALISLRVLPHYWGPLGFFLAGVGVALSLTMIVLAHRRYQAHHRLLTSREYLDSGMPDGALPALLVAICIGAGMLAVTLVFTI
jgi:putative membrane protein